MKVIWEHLKLTISFRFIAIITSLMIWGILPISLMMLKLTISRKKGDLTLGDKVSISDNIIPYEKNSHATILYDPYCILQNCLAFYYPYSWIQPEETKNLYQIPIIQPDDTNNI